MKSLPIILTQLHDSQVEAYKVENFPQGEPKNSYGIRDAWNKILDFIKPEEKLEDLV